MTAFLRNEIRGLQNIIAQEREAHQMTRTEMEYAFAQLAQKDNALAAERNALQKANAEIAELQQRLALK